MSTLVLGHKISFRDWQTRLASIAAFAQVLLPLAAQVAHPPSQAAHPALSHLFGLPSLVPLLLDDLSYRRQV
jgi:hypothetical protein